MSDGNVPLTIIGIGSSAGGLEAIRELVSTLPAEAPATYVVVQHMSPHHKSLMTELVSRQTNLSVRDVADGTRPEANVVYITPPNHDVLYRDGMLQLIPPSPELASPKPSVDRFLLSLADAHGEKSMGIILSGTGSDGAYGVQAIRAAGGITIAQDGASAKYDGMPRAAIQTGCVDLILRPEAIGTHLQKILSSPRNFDSIQQDGREDTPNSDLLQILVARTRVDFREYKQTTISRRIERRMIALGIETLEEYTRFLRHTPQAVDALFKDLLISVTRFFRDQEEFEALREMLPALIKLREGNPLRVWIAGCATGEEAYSIAILIAEALGGPNTNLKDYVQIFATDIDSEALKVARKGVYGMAALDDIPGDLAKQYLITEADGVKVIENLRSAILFSEHNVCQDPPFQNIDLLCCRNLLIYFGASLQKKVMARFFYAMRQTGLLFLGTAETTSGSTNLFNPAEASSHIFRKRAVNPSEPSHYNVQSPSSMALRRAPSQGREAVSAERLLFDSLAQSLGENSILVSEDYTIARVFGDVSAYVEFTSRSSLKMQLSLLRTPLREEARSLITLALKTKQKRSGARHLLADDDTSEVRLEVYPIIAKSINERACLVVFTTLEVDKKEPPVEFFEPDSPGAVERIRFLENELETTREALQQTIEELETSNEELQSLNEELQSTNEELQATNEELETSNEELESTNEELITVNEELQVTASELTGRSSQYGSVLENAPMGILVMDTALQVTQATTRALGIFNLSHPLSNPHISQFKVPEGYPPLAQFCSEALQLGEPKEVEFASEGTRIALNCSPYFDMHGAILGVTLVAKESPNFAREMEAIFRQSQLLLMQRTESGRILRASTKMAELLGIPLPELLGQNIKDVVPVTAAGWLLSKDQDLLDGPDAHTSEVVKLQVSEDMPPLWFSVERFEYQGTAERERSVITVATDITELQVARQNAETMLSQLRLLQDFANVGYWSLDVASGAVDWSDEVCRIHDVNPGTNPRDLDAGIAYYHPDDADRVATLVSDAITKNAPFEFKARLLRSNGDVVPVEARGLPVTQEDGTVVQLVGIFRKIAQDAPA